MVLMVSACIHPSEEDVSHKEVKLKLVHSGINADGLDGSQGLIWITDKVRFVSLWQTLQRPALGSNTKTAPTIDFKRYGVLLVLMGQKRSGGYGIELMADRSEIENQTAFIPVRWNEPRKGIMVSQAITHPYLMLRMNLGDYRRVTVLDQHGQTPMTLDIKERR